MAKIKICGIRRDKDIEIVNKYKPDYIGFVFAKSKRHISNTNAKVLRDKLKPGIKVVGVFRNQNIGYIEKCSSIIDVIQLHGSEDENYVIELKKRIPNKTIIKAYNKDKNARYLLVDSINPGNGEKIDWNNLKRNDKRLFLAGGINANNIDEAIKLNPYCIDVSSGAETKGFKDEIKIKELIEKVRSNGKR